MTRQKMNNFFVNGEYNNYDPFLNPPVPTLDI